MKAPTLLAIGFSACCCPLLTLADNSQTKELETAQNRKEDALIRSMLNQDWDKQSFSFPKIILASSKKKVIPIDQGNPTHTAILKAIQEATQRTIRDLNQTPLKQIKRINEVSRLAEDILCKHLNAQKSLQCCIPLNSQGHAQRSGYPDLWITHTGQNGKTTHIYLDPKLYQRDSETSTLRTFYFKPRSSTLKVQHHAIHLLLGIQHNGNQGSWHFEHGTLCDLSELKVRFKAEFQASNRDIYRKPAIIQRSDD
ncbi:hypothetical protein HW115_13660 [Verrucomicrobiaceae bacterium N1E253]|uniref:Uncharacterized protein n=1 Tax=Oceaniferula marina TaxID=2748318 RepID=A0A851GR37_9BACT|nr:hypothetical protein [Oceaniferula marina]NWK56664.1 hypothetical protein [Oceaniferula marina]